MMRCGENNHHVHDGYEKEMAPPSNVNDTDEDESNNSITIITDGKTLFRSVLPSVTLIRNIQLI